jgi:CRP/FNR family transcriptional regulator, cyclic AMP receptor protein
LNLIRRSRTRFRSFELALRWKTREPDSQNESGSGDRTIIVVVDRKQLEGVRFFSSLSKQELEKLARWTDQISVGEGHVLASEGEFAHEFFVIEDGSAEVLQNGERISELGPGDFFGEIGLIETERRTATVVATRPMQLIVMGQREFKQMEQEMPAVADRIRSAIRARLDES